MIASGTDAENAEFMMNAWRGGAAAVSGQFAKNLHRFARQQPGAAPTRLMYAGDLPDLKRVDSNGGGGWSIVLKYHPDRAHRDQATPDDAPLSIRRLWQHRGSPPIFRYVVNPNTQARYLRRYLRRNDEVEVGDFALAQGLSVNALAKVPYYLLLYGSPRDLPWSLQYDLNGSRAVGRLDLTEEEGLGHYIDRLIDGWEDDGAKVSRTLVWAVDQHGGARDVTQILRDFVAYPLHGKFTAEPIVDQREFLDGAQATAERLCRRLGQIRPGLVVTTSHGAILGSACRARRLEALGLPVDQDWSLLDPTLLLDLWKPDGAVWYCHACCSAGTDDSSRYTSLVDPNCEAAEVLRDASNLGETVSPLPRLLLGSNRPLRAFVGHVGPTFSWTLREPTTRERLTDPILDAFYDRFYQREAWPLGHSLRAIYEPLATLHGEYETQRQQHRKRPTTTRTPIVDRKLTAEDIRSIVLLGDPAALRPPA